MWAWYKDLSTDFKYTEKSGKKNMFFFRNGKHNIKKHKKQNRTKKRTDFFGIAYMCSKKKEQKTSEFVGQVLFLSFVTSNWLFFSAINAFASHCIKNRVWSPTHVSNLSKTINGTLKKIQFFADAFTCWIWQRPLTAPHQFEV